jgi:hypothetical protein
MCPDYRLVSLSIKLLEWTYRVDERRVGFTLWQEMGVITEEGSWETGVEWRSLVELLQLFGSQGDLERLPRQQLPFL